MHLGTNEANPAIILHFGSNQANASNTGANRHKRSQTDGTVQFGTDEPNAGQGMQIGTSEAIFGGSTTARHHLRPAPGAAGATKPIQYGRKFNNLPIEANAVGRTKPTR